MCNDCCYVLAPRFVSYSTVMSAGWIRRVFCMNELREPLRENCHLNYEISSFFFISYGKKYWNQLLVCVCGREFRECWSSLWDRCSQFAVISVSLVGALMRPEIVVLFRLLFHRVITSLKNEHLLDILKLYMQPFPPFQNLPYEQIIGTPMGSDRFRLHHFHCSSGIMKQTPVTKSALTIRRLMLGSCPIYNGVA